MQIPSNIISDSFGQIRFLFLCADNFVQVCTKCKSREDKIKLADDMDLNGCMNICESRRDCAGIEFWYGSGTCRKCNPYCTESYLNTNDPGYPPVVYRKV